MRYGALRALLLFPSAEEVAEHVSHGLSRVFGRLLVRLLAHRRVGHFFVSCVENLPKRESDSEREK